MLTLHSVYRKKENKCERKGPSYRGVPIQMTLVCVCVQHTQVYFNYSNDTIYFRSAGFSVSIQL
jgi:hypothetical protein